MKEHSDDQSKKPEWWPKTPYPEHIFPMTTAEYVAAIPDPGLRTAVSGHLARWAWGVAEQVIWERMQDAYRSSADSTAKISEALSILAGFCTCPADDELILSARAELAVLRSDK